jgi:hypothetical protein
MPDSPKEPKADPTVTELLIRAKKAIESGHASLRDAAEAIAAAQQQGATQRRIADAVGKSPAWVNRLSQWRRGGYRDDTAFGPTAKAARLRAQDVQAESQSQGKEAQVDVTHLLCRTAMRHARAAFFFWLWRTVTA